MLAAVQCLQSARRIHLGERNDEIVPDALDGLSAGLFLVDATGPIVHADAAGHGISGAAIFLRWIDNRLISATRSSIKALRESFPAPAAATPRSASRASPCR